MSVNKKIPKIRDIIIWIVSVFVLLFITLCLCIIGAWLSNPFVLFNKSVLGACIWVIALNIFGYFFWCKIVMAATKTDYWLWVLSQIIVVIMCIILI